jgi:hypothetical protein
MQLLSLFHVSNVVQMKIFDSLPLNAAQGQLSWAISSATATVIPDAVVVKAFHALVASLAVLCFLLHQ